MLENKSPAERENNSNRIAQEQLTKAINSKVVFAFIGAGSSKKLGYPLWEELIAILEKDVKEKDPSIDLRIYKDNQDHKRDPLWYAEVLRSYLDESKFYLTISENFKPKKDNWTPYHQKIMKTPFRHYITTNYDTVLEHTSYSLPRSIDSFCWKDKEMLRVFFKDLTSQNHPIPVIFIIFTGFIIRKTL